MSRLQLALNVDDLETSIAFYSSALRHRAGQGPARLRQLRHRRAAAEAGAHREPRPGRLDQPPRRRGRRHDIVDAEQTRLAAAGLASVDERGTTCCYAEQDKFWVQGAPNGEQWEVYTITDDLAGPADAVVEESREHLTGDAQPCCA